MLASIDLVLVKELMFKMMFILPPHYFTKFLFFSVYLIAKSLVLMYLSFRAVCDLC